LASVPTGNSLGSYEANEIGDGDFKRYNGRGVLQAVSKINEIIKPRLIGFRNKRTGKNRSNPY
jgi:enolase